MRFDKPSDLILAARDEVIRRGHTKHHSITPKGTVCVSGALSLVTGAKVTWNMHSLFPKIDPIPREALPLHGEAWTYICRAVPRGLSCGVTFNDQKDTTEQEILDLLFDAAIAAKEDGR